MDNFSRNVYVEEVNKSISTEFKFYLNENRKGALNDVVDANTEFKNDYECNRVSVSPQESFALTSQNKTLEANIYLSETLTVPSSTLDSVLEKSKDIGQTHNSYIADDALVPQVHVPHTSRNMANKINLPQFTQELKCKDAIQNTSESNNSNKLHCTKDMYTELNGEFHNSELKNNLLSKVPVSIHKPRQSQMKSSVNNSNMATISSSKSTMSHSTLSLADKMAWAVRAARDKLDSASNVSECSSNFDLESNCSEQAETMSTISDVSGYEEEMYRIRRLLLQDSPPVICESSLSSLGKNNLKSRECHLNGNIDVNEVPSENYDILLYKLRTQLQSVLEEKEKLTIKLSDVESRLSVEWHDKFQVVLREKAHLEGCLESMQAEIDALHAERQQNLYQAKGAANEAKSKSLLETKQLFLELESLTAENAKLIKQVREMNIKFQERNLQLELLESEKIQLKNDLRETESSNETLRITLQELKVDFESKLSAIEGLKKKITDLHVECQSSLQAKLKADNISAFFKNELDTTRNSFCWYQEQLQNCQEAKVKMQQELMAAQTNLVACNHLMEKIKGEKALLLQVVEDNQKRAVREKESLLQKLELIQADMLEREATILMHVHKDNVATETISLVSAKLKHLEEERSKQVNISFEDQNLKIEDLKNELISKESTLKALELENSDLMKNVTALQKTLNEKEISNQIIGNKFKHLEMVHQQLTEAMKCKDEILLNVKNEKVALEVALSAAVNEKIEVDIATSKLREDFYQMANSFKCMKLEIQSKEKHTKDLKEEIHNLQQQNQHLATSLEEKAKDVEDLIDLKRKLISLGDLEQNSSNLISLNEELKTKLSERSETLKFYKNNIKKLEESLEFREQQLHNQTQNFEVYQNEMKAQENRIVELQTEKQLTLNDNNKLQVLIKELNEDKLVLNKELESLKHQMKQANIIIEQFSDLCKGTEREKKEIGRQLELALNDLQKANNLHTNGNKDRNIDIETINISESEECVGSETKTSTCTLLQHHTEETKRCIEQIEEHIISFLEKNVHIDVEIWDKSCDTEENLLHRLNAISCAVKSMIFKLNQNFTEIESLKIYKSDLEDEILRLKIDLQKYSHTEAQQKNSKETQTISCNAQNNSNLQVDGSCIKDKEIKKLKDILTLQEVDQREKYKRYEANVRTLLKKVKEHMRGRKFAERQLEQLGGSGHSSFNLSEAEALRLEIKKLEAALEISNTKLEEQRKIAEKSHISLLELEKERGKLEKSHESTNDSSTAENINGIFSEADDFDQKAWNIKYQQITTRIVEMEHEAKAFVSTINKLRKQIFTEKCESSQLRKQLSSIQLGLNNANDLIERRNKELKQADIAYNEVLEKYNGLHNELQFEKDQHEKCLLNMEKLKCELEETKTKDPLLADQIKSLSYHLHQRQQEVSALEEKIILAEQNWSSLENGYHRRLNSLQKDIEKLKKEIDIIRKDKFTLQAQTAELRAGLQSTIDQNKVLKLKLDAYSCDNRLILPDLTSSLPSPPVIYDDAQIAELLHYSTVLPQNKPLNNLQSCLDSLKQEMASLQRQIAEKTSGYASQDIAKLNETESTVQNI